MRKENHEYLFDVIEDKFFLKSDSRLPITKSTKSDRMNTNDYQKKYLNTSPASGLNSASIDLMHSTLDDRLMKTCQYSHPE